jgi:hypothetical protein
MQHALTSRFTLRQNLPGNIFFAHGRTRVFLHTLAEIP